MAKQSKGSKQAKPAALPPFSCYAGGKAATGGAVQYLVVWAKAGAKVATNAKAVAYRPHAGGPCVGYYGKHAVAAAKAALAGKAPPKAGAKPVKGLGTVHRNPNG